MKPEKQNPSWLRSGGLYALVGFLVLVLGFVAVTFILLTRESRYEQEWVRLATDMQIHSQQMAKSAAEAVEGQRTAFLQSLSLPRAVLDKIYAENALRLVSDVQ